VVVKWRWLFYWSWQKMSLKVLLKSGLTQIPLETNCLLPPSATY